MRASYLLWGFALIAGVASAAAIEMDQPVVSPTNTPNVAQVLVSPLTLYVDPTGNDSNACTATGTSACATPNGALAKIPSTIGAPAVINVADGTYNRMNIVGFQFTDGGSLSVVGNINTSATPTRADGGIKTIVNTSVPVPSLADNENTFSVNALKGEFIRMTSGAQVNQRRVIVSNTATVLDIVRPFNTPPVAGDTYIIEKPGFILNGTSAPLSIIGNMGSGLNSASGATQPIGITGVSVETTSGTACTLLNNLAGVQFTGVRCITSSGAALSWVDNPGVVSTVNLYASSPAASSINRMGRLINSSGGGFMLTSSVAGSTVVVNNVQDFFGAGAVIENTAASGGTCMTSRSSFYQSASATSTSMWQLRCASGSTGSTGASLLPGSSLFFDNLNISNCVTGISATQNAVAVVDSAGVTTATDAFAVTKGASIFFNGAGTPTYTTVTNETTVDGVAGTWAAMSATTCRIGAVQNSKICN